VRDAFRVVAWAVDAAAASVGPPGDRPPRPSEGVAVSRSDRGRVSVRVPEDGFPLVHVDG